MKPQIKKSGNPFVKMLQDKKRIHEAICNGTPIANLKDIKFVKPV
jgi:hypothetical protein